MENTISLTNLIGKEIETIRYALVKNGGLDVFSSYIKLTTGQIIQFPIYIDESVKAAESFVVEFDNCDSVDNDFKAAVENMKIVNVHFNYVNDEIETGQSCYLELENGTFLYEQNLGITGVDPANIFKVSKGEFLKRNSELNYNVKSFL